MNFNNYDLNVSLSSSLVNIDEKSRSNLFAWRGQFSPQLIEEILLNYSSSDSVIFDPFLGSGTVLYEAALLNLKAYGCEINPAAVAFAKIYELINNPKQSTLKIINEIEAMVSPYTNNLPISKGKEIENIQSELLHEFENTTDTIKKKILMSLFTALDFGAKKLNAKRVNNVWGTLRSNIENLPVSNNEIVCYQSDARRSPLKDNLIDFVITSPPYINVFNYHQNYRKSVEATGENVLKVAKSEIGANRKFRQNRFLTVVQYCMDISQVFIELRRVCKKKAKIIFIVGRESNVRRTPFKNANLITFVAQECGFVLEGQQHRVFTNKFGKSIFEEILRFSIGELVTGDLIETSREIGRNALKNALDYANEDVISEINEAYEKSLKIQPSPFLEI